MLDCKVWCDNFQQLYNECEILEKCGKVKSKFGDIKKSCMCFLLNKITNSNEVGIIVRDNYVLFTSKKDSFEKQDVIDLSSFGYINQKSRKYEFYTMQCFLRTIHMLIRKDFFIRPFNSYYKLLDYLFDNSNVIEGFYLFIDYENKVIDISIYKEVFNECEMVDGSFTFENDLKNLTD